MGDKLSRALIDIAFSMILLVFIIAGKKYNLKMLIMFVSIIIIFTISGYFTQRVYIMAYAFFIIAATRCNSGDSAIKAALIGSAVSGAIVLILSQIGYIPDIEMMRGSANVNLFYSEVAHCFGYSYYHHIPYKFYFVMLGVMKVKNKEMSWCEIFLWGLANFVVFYYTTVRLTFYLGFLALALYIVLIKFDWFRINNKATKGIMTLSFPVMTVGTILFNYFYSERYKIYAMLNLFASNRLRLGHEAFERYSIKLFGQMINTSIATSTTRHFYLDSGYIYAILGYGVFFSIIVVLMYSYLCNFACNKNDKALLIWLIGVLIFTVSNNEWVELTKNPILILFPIAWSQEVSARTGERCLAGARDLAY